MTNAVESMLLFILLTWPAKTLISGSAIVTRTPSTNPDIRRSGTLFFSVSFAPSWLPTGRKAMSTPNKKKVRPITRDRDEKIKSKKVGREYKMPKVNVIKYMMAEQ